MKERIKEILKESIKIPNRIAIFDFDGSLVQSPMRQDGEKVYEKKTGESWPHVGWWGQKDSLNMDIFDIPTIHEAIYIYNRERQNPDTLMVMMTGRMAKLAPEVEKILDHYNLKFDEYLYNTGGDTLSVKIRYLDKLVHKYPSADSMIMVEDRPAHVVEFKKWGAAQHLKFEIVVIKSGHHD